MKYLFIFVMMLFTLGVSAQEDAAPNYQLREFTAREFAYGLPNFGFVWFATDDNEAVDLILAAETEFLIRFGDTANFYELQSMFEHLRIEVSSRNYRETASVIDLDEWMARIIERWLIENPTDLSVSNSIATYSITITITPHDFDLDGENEWILDTQYISAGETVYHNFLVADGSDSIYRVLDLPIPTPTNDGGWNDEGIDRFKSYGWRDITGDGQMEWLFSTSEYGPGGPGYTGVINTIYVLGWQNGEIVQFYSGSGALRNIDDDDALEFINTKIAMDNWGCGTRTEEAWDWDGSGAYVRQPDEITHLDCTGREAEEAMWARNFETAAALYETFFVENAEAWAEELDCVEECLTGQFPQIYLYFLGRRVIAYAMLGDTAAVQRSLDEAELYAASSDFITALINTETTDAETLCNVAYEYFTTYRPQSSEWFSPVLPGRIIPNVLDGWNHSVGFNVDPAWSGCDISMFQDSPAPTETPIPTLAPPTPNPQAVQNPAVSEYDFYRAFWAEDYEAMLTIAETIELNEGRWLYWQGLLYEIQGRPDEALDAYVTLYLNYPGTWWAWLAGLHIEVVGDKQ